MSEHEINNGAAANGDKPKFQLITIAFDPETQTVQGFEFAAEEFRSWQFISAVLAMAKESADLRVRAAIMQATQAAQMQAQQDALIRKKLLRG